MKLKPIAVPNRPRGIKFEIAALADPRFVVSAAAATIDLFDSITPDTPTQIAAALRQMAGRPVTLRLNSPGGDPFSGMTAFNLLSGYAADITVEILGIAASAASVVAMGGDVIRIATGAQVMIHRATAGVLGVADDMRSMASALDQVDAGMAQIYAAKTGLPLAQITDLMAAETFMSSDTAVSLGFADEQLDRAAAAAPKIVAEAVPGSKRELEEQFRNLGFSRAVAARMTAAAWPAAHPNGSAEPEPELESEIDLDAIAQAIANGVTAAVPPSRFR